VRTFRAKASPLQHLKPCIRIPGFSYQLGDKEAEMPMGLPLAPQRLLPLSHPDNGQRRRRSDNDEETAPTGASSPLYLVHLIEYLQRYAHEHRIEAGQEVQFDIRHALALIALEPMRPH